MRISLEDAAEQVVRLERLTGYQRGTSAEAMEFRGRLAEAIMKACNRFGVSAESLVDETLQVTLRCPSDHELYTFAEAVRAIEDMKRGPKAADKPRYEPDCGKCHGTGWEIVYMLHTQERGYVRKERISREMYDRLSAKTMDSKIQRVYEGAKRCVCDPGTSSWTKDQIREHDERWAKFCADHKNYRLLSGKTMAILRGNANV